MLRLLGLIFFFQFTMYAQAEVNTSSGGGGCTACDKQAPGNCTLPREMNHKAEDNCFASNLNNEAKKNKGHESQRECLMKVREAFEHAANVKVVPWCLNASDSGKCLQEFGMVPAWTTEKENRYPNPPAPTVTKRSGKEWSVTWSIARSKAKVNGKECDLPEKLPPGTTLVYGGTNGGVGHVEVVTDEGLVCSDFCSTSLISERTHDRWLIGIYLPPPTAYKGACQGNVENPWGSCGG